MGRKSFLNAHFIDGVSGHLLTQQRKNWSNR